MDPAPPRFDPIACAQIVALIEQSNNEVFKLMSDQGRPCSDKQEPHSTRFKAHILALLPEWVEVSKSHKGRKDVYISHKEKVVDELARTHRGLVLRLT